jgi:hypothetical protein
MTTFSLPIVPGLSPSPTLQRYAYTSGSTTVGAAVGSAVTGVVDGTYSHVWNFDVSAWAVGDYWVLLSGASSPNALPWPCRVTATEATYYPTLAEFLLDVPQDVVVNSNTQPTATLFKPTQPIIIGDDYLLAVGGRHFEWIVNSISGYAASDLGCKWGGKAVAAYGEQAVGAGWLVTGTVTAVTGGLSLKFDLPKATTQALMAGDYASSIEVYTLVGGYEVTRVTARYPFQLAEKQT